MNRIKIIFMLIFTLFLPGSTNHYSNRYVQVDCNVFDFGGRLFKRLPGMMCHFFDDGSYLLSTYPKGNLKYFSFHNSILWSKKDNVAHHELNVSADQKKIAYIMDDIRESNGVKIRYDVLKIVDRKGRDLYSWDTFEHWNEILQLLKVANKGEPPSYTFNHTFHGPMIEYTHVNSFKEIPPNKLYPSVSYLKPGNYLGEMNCLGLFFIFNPTLTKIEKVFHYQNFLGCNAHDAQVLPNGHFLFFRNFTRQPNDGPSLVEMDPVSKHIVWSHAIDSSDKHESNYQGSVELLKNGNYLYCDKGHADNMGVVEISRTGIIANALDQQMIVKLQSYKPYRARMLKSEKILEYSW